MRTTNGCFYGTDTDTYYLDSAGQAWLISGDSLRKPAKARTIPVDAVELSEQVLDDQHREDAAEIEKRLAEV